jgi:hypothetical protein
VLIKILDGTAHGKNLKNYSHIIGLGKKNGGIVYNSR